MPWACGSRYGLDTNDVAQMSPFTSPHAGTHSVWFRLFYSKETGYTAGYANGLSAGNTAVWGHFYGSPWRLYANSAATTYYDGDAQLNDRQWNTFGWSWDGSSATNDPTCYANGVIKTVGSGLTQTGADAAPNINYSQIYVGNRAALGRPVAGLWEDICFWNEILTAEEFDLLRGGESPLNIRRHALVCYAPLNERTHYQNVVSGAVGTTNLRGGVFLDGSHSDPEVHRSDFYRSPARRKYPYFGVSAGGAVTSSFSALSGAIGASGASKSVSIGLSAIAGSIGSASGTKSASAGISALAGLLAALETAGVGTTDFNAIAGALVSVTHSTARLSTIEGKVGSVGSVAGLRGAISSLQAIAGSVAAIAGTTSLDRTSSFAAIAGAAAALSKTTARIADLVARAGVLGTNTPATIRAAQIAAVAGLRAAIAGINVETAGRLLTVSASAQAAYECAVSARAAYNCTVSEAIVQ